MCRGSDRRIVGVAAGLQRREITRYPGILALVVVVRLVVRVRKRLRVRVGVMRVRVRVRVRVRMGVLVDGHRP